ncbi:hypothetical protein HOY82DRAFT_563454, partial [Tuber indicum]
QFLFFSPLAFFDSFSSCLYLAHRYFTLLRDLCMCIDCSWIRFSAQQIQNYEFSLLFCGAGRAQVNECLPGDGEERNICWLEFTRFVYFPRYRRNDAHDTRCTTAIPTVMISERIDLGCRAVSSRVTWRYIQLKLTVLSEYCTSIRL